MPSSIDKSSVTPVEDKQQPEDLTDEGLLAYEIDPKEKKRLLRKLDSFIAPVLMILYLIAFLDRSNIGNAAVGGMTTALKLPADGLSVATSIFYATYVSFETPMTTFLKSLRASRLIPTVVILWGTTVMASAWMKNYGGLIATRLVLGMLEAALTPCLFLWITAFYQRDELARRQCFLFISAALSGVVGGLIAAGLLKMNGLAGMEGWQWLYCVEGVITIVIGIIAIPFVPDSYEEAWYLTRRQKFLMRVREVQSREYMGDASFSWGEVKKAFTDPIVYLSGFVQMGLDTCLYGFSTFLVVIINQLGYSSINSQLLTAPIYFWAALVYFIGALISDRYNKRFWLIFPLAGVSVAGYAILVAVHGNVGVSLFACFLTGTGIYIGVGLSVTWISVNMAGYRKRSTAIGLQQTLGNIGGIIAGQIYRSTDKPYYRLGHSISLGAMVLAMMGMIVEVMIYKSRNDAKDRMTEEEKQRQDLDGAAGDRHYSFKQVW
ncbi:major facilitator superfamily transporter [Marasmius fiardii PR-910]|nr:major facilitator superfamily transporter [Marasmius fiardii PR-910]